MENLSRNRRGRSGLNYPARELSFPIIEKKATKNSGRLNRFLLIQLIAVTVVLAVSGVVRLCAPDAFSDLKSGLTEQSVFGKNVGDLWAEGEQAVRSNELLKGLFFAEEQGSAVQTASLIMENSPEC